MHNMIISPSSLKDYNAGLMFASAICVVIMTTRFIRVIEI